LHKNVCGSKEKPKKKISTRKKNDTGQQRDLEIWDTHTHTYKARDDSKVQKDVGFSDADGDRLGIWQSASLVTPSC